MEQKSMRQVIIMRGISGAGKSTYVAKNFPDAIVCSADHYFMVGGQYQFNPAKLKEAHEACRLRFSGALIFEKELIVVDNTNTQKWEFDVYVWEAKKKYGYDVKVIRLNVPASIAWKRNTHMVPLEAIHKMEARFEDYEGEETVVNS